ncbi:Kinesin motor domain, conserved site,P-loop containing nucleoside triphosphate hydrolase,Kinesin motor [Cinara cedri]|uniref:Kinesin-like protein n=1 Tax=Cinara cedri TaxID=506608 RepID=A0A5E4LYR9_9HEMI|nr:Kinesin motor domain, conserved site,P-loop containing nucleoside triphosphate hydrolase,Kinesin motor [Cinara cedri]
MENSKEIDSTRFGQRRVNGKPKKVLDYSFELNSGIPKIDVSLRLKPQLDNSHRYDNTLTVLNNTSVSYYNGSIREGITEFTFSNVFGSNVGQKEFFNIWVRDKVLRFLNGNNELLFAYGTTNAEKTYTMHGSLNDPGLIPRTLVFVFNTLNNKLMEQCKYKPDKVMAAKVLDEQLMEHEENIRNKILNNLSYEKIEGDDKYSPQLDEGQTINGIDHLNSNNIGKIFDLLKNDDKVSLDHGDVSYTVWVTYSEIYNESIYDLFDINCSANQKRIPLKLALDQNKNIYVQGLTHVLVRSAEEAYKAMFFGRNNLKITSNTLSRSHCIFTLKLMRIENIKSPTTAVISSFTFCDLAGSERLKKTMNIAERLTESKKINTSLLVLNKCFSVLRDNQKRGDNHLVPFRESKLTQMFQTALIGSNQTCISMAVNVDISPGLFEETKQVLFMFAIVRSIITLKSKNNSKSESSFVVLAANNDKNLTQAKFKQSIQQIFIFIYSGQSHYVRHLLSLKVDHKDSETKVLKAAHQKEIDKKNQEIKNCKIMFTEVYAKYKNMVDNSNKINNRFDEVCQFLEERDLEIERLIGLLEAKENLIIEMKIYQDQQKSKYAEKKTLECMEEKLKRKKKKYKICLQDKSKIAEKYQILKQLFRIKAKSFDQLTLSNTELSSELADIKSKMTELKEYAATFESTLVDNEMRYNKELQAALKKKQMKPDSKNITVLTDINNVQCPLTMIIDCDSEENKNTEKKSTIKSRTKTPMSTTKKKKNIKYDDTPEMCDKILYEIINNIPNSTHKRKLFDNKPPLSDNSKIFTDNRLDSILTPTNALHQTSKFRIKKSKK